jgi:predicted phage-related endonuclease
MQTLQLVQGSAEWHAHRARHFNASDAPAMLSCSPYCTRTQLMHRIRTGIAEDIDAGTQRRFNDGHRFERLARPLAEAILDDDLAPLVGVLGELSASLDGVTMDGTTVWEAKSLNDDLREALPYSGRDSHVHNDSARLPKHFRVQMEQQLLVAAAKRVLFTASQWSNDDALLDDRHCWYASDPALRAEIVAGWQQFKADLATYEPSAGVVEKVIAEPVEALPAPYVEVTGQLTLKDNFKAFEQSVRHFLEHKLIRSPKTDQDFVNLDAQIKQMKNGRQSLKASKAQMLAQVQPVDQATKTADMLDKMLQQACSMAEDLMQREKDVRKAEIVRVGIDALAAHIAALNVRLGRPLMPATATAVDFGGAIKGLRSLASMEDAIASRLATAKIDANAIADRIQVNLRAIDAHPEYVYLFTDRATLVLKDADACAVIVSGRIAEHKAAEERKLEAERQRIRQEEEARAAAIARQQEAERQAAEAKAQREREEAAARAQREAEADPANARDIMLAQVAANTGLPLDRPLDDAPTGFAPAQPAANTTPMRGFGAFPPAAAAPKGPPTLKLGDLCARFGPGVTLTAAFFDGLGFAPTKGERNASLFCEEDVPAICDAVSAHFQAVKVRHLEKAA